MLWNRDREGRTVLRSAVTGEDQLYYAEEEVYLADISTNGQYRVTQHFLDALGRETNTVVYAGSIPGEAVVASTSNSKVHSQVSTEYPRGDSDCSVHMDERGKVTVRRTDILGDSTEMGETVFTNGVEVVTTKSRSYFGGGSSTRREWDGDKFAEERRFDEYDTDGRRIAYVVTESFDCGIVTNSVTTYDLLGRAASVSVPGANGARIVTVNVYDATSSRLVSSTETGSSAVIYEYNSRGERSRMTRNGCSLARETSYGVISGCVFRVEAVLQQTGSVTNSVTVRKERLSGLSISLRAQTIVTDVSGVETATTRSYEALTGQETTIQRTGLALPVVTMSRFGFDVQQTTRDERTMTDYDALGRAACLCRLDPDSAITNRIERMSYDESGNFVGETVDLMDGRLQTNGFAYDPLNRRISATNALGHVVETTYDALGRVVRSDGDVAPLVSVFDSAGRGTRLGTTRDGGATWDETYWLHDVACGMTTNKVYADGSRIVCAYTDNGRRTRTTWARGAWREHAYNGRNLVSGTTYSGVDTPAVVYTYADSGRLATATLADGTSTVYSRDDRLLVTNEMVTSGSHVLAIQRAYDEARRISLSRCVWQGNSYATHARHYDSENRICGYTFTNVLGRSLSVAFSYHGSYLTNAVCVLPGGSNFTARLTRESARRELVAQRDYLFNGISVYSYSTTYDVIGRPVSAVDSCPWARTWSYNRRSELTAATVGGDSYGYSYDSIGNRVWSSTNGVTTSYAANQLNQYTSILADSATMRVPTYDADGNLTNDCMFVYAYDAENRLVSAYPLVPGTGALAVENAYDHRHRRVRKTVKRFDGLVWALAETHAFVWDDGNIVLETVSDTEGTEHVIEYFWGPDKSGTEQGAGGVGGLLAVSYDGQYHLPCYDHNGNIVCYISEEGTVSAGYLYDPYGNVISQTDSMASQLFFGFSTKYHDREIGMVSYQRRFYHPVLGRWLNRDPIEEDGGENQYVFCGNNAIFFL